MLKQKLSDPQQKLQYKYTEHIHRMKPNSTKRKEEIQCRSFEFILIKFDVTTRKLNHQYDIQLAVTKTRFFPWNVAMKCDTHDGNSIFGVDSASYPISLMLHDSITYEIDM